MPRYIANTVITAKVETTALTDAVPTGSADAVLGSEMTITPLDPTYVDRNLMLPYFGGSQQLIDTANVKLDYTVELAGSGTAATAPQWGDLLLGCACAEASLTTPNRVEYTPVSTALKTLTQYYYDDGALHKVLGSMGNAKIKAKKGDVPKLMLSFLGADGGLTATSNASTTLTAWKTPPTMNVANVVDITLGATLTTGVLSGGTLYQSDGLEVDIGNRSQWISTLSSERADITGRKTTGSVSFELTAAQEVTLMAAVKASTLQSLALTIGTTTGNKIILFYPNVQLANPKKTSLNGVRMVSYDLFMVPLIGNDDFRFVSL